MGDALRKWIRGWLGIENQDARIGVLAQSRAKMAADLETAKADALEARADAAKALEVALDCQKLLTQQAAKRKIETKRPNWRTFRAQAEKATDTEEA